jgi:hypothetical protein
MIAKTYFAAGNTGAQRIIADTDFFVDISICKVVFATSHSTDDNCDGVRSRKRREVGRQTLRGGVTRECCVRHRQVKVQESTAPPTDFDSIGREMIGDRIL